MALSHLNQKDLSRGAIAQSKCGRLHRNFLKTDFVLDNESYFTYHTPQLLEMMDFTPAILKMLLQH